VRIVVDQEKCAGHGRCYDLAPDVFEPDDEGHVQLLSEERIPDDLENEARIASLNCPERALIVVE